MKTANRVRGIGLFYCHEGVRETTEHTPRRQRWLVTFEHRHDGRLLARDHRSTPCFVTEIQARRTRRLDYEDPRPAVALTHREIGRGRRGQPADARLHEDMRRRLRKLRFD